ncbi:Gfo/Idh/MocA family protein [Rheinheimera sp. 4Y26]|uniref:Gfo/Idh/MocA family protein n=1 Tax=Rheinheimera sp. 4Y26 TaxID=2977811 RepID=UPI0021B0E4A9|nr:Gfo/Idh/MocA family oxidoreductase [Rheinheimera sp. 4Y26]MCT6698736.1 Gfo/Idh/MocA family oxidoreductase [Rheinheimera sp. 4Y26]
MTNQIISSNTEQHLRPGTGQPLRWGIIGCGAVTEVKSGPAYQQVPGFVLQAVMRRDAAKAEDYARRHQVPLWFSDADLLINHPEVDAVYIATPPDSHLFYALKVAAAGKICCVEKPMALNSAECKQMNAAFAKAGKPLFVAYYRRSLPRFLQVKDWLQQGAIGTVRHLHWSFSRPPNAADVAGQANWRTDPAKAGGGYFVDLASHGLDLFAYLLGDIVDAKGIALNQQGLYQAEDAVSACWRFAIGAAGAGVEGADDNAVPDATGSGYWNFAAFERRDQVEIIGSAGRIEFSVFAEAPLVLTTATGRTESFIDNPAHIQLHHVANMARQLSSGEPHPSSGETAMHATLVMEQILQNAIAN